MSNFSPAITNGFPLSLNLTFLPDSIQWELRPAPLPSSVQGHRPPVLLLRAHPLSAGQRLTKGGVSHVGVGVEDPVQGWKPRQADACTLLLWWELLGGLRSVKGCSAHWVCYCLSCDTAPQTLPTPRLHCLALVHSRGKQPPSPIPIPVTHILSTAAVLLVLRMRQECHPLQKVT